VWTEENRCCAGPDKLQYREFQEPHHAGGLGLDWSIDAIITTIAVMIAHNSDTFTWDAARRGTAVPSNWKRWTLITEYVCIIAW
jgi:hypothetical protein